MPVVSSVVLRDPQAVRIMSVINYVEISFYFLHGVPSFVCN